MTKVAIDHVTVDFPILDANRSFRKAIFSGPIGGIIRRETGRRIIIRALEDVSFVAEEGDKYGLIGHNGAGKSTLLRVITSVYEPVAGTVEVEGRISPMFNISIGMDLEDTGFENLTSMGLYMGLSGREIRERIDEIVDFCELGDFMHLPVRSYSTGMQMRLGFAIATSIDPDILLFDEWLGAGDARFMEKATARINGLVERSSLFILASHSEDLIRNNCNKAILLDHGRVLADGDVDDVLREYTALTAAADD